MSEVTRVGTPVDTAALSALHVNTGRDGAKHYTTMLLPTHV